jgi:uncharacterized protein YndB with AHSA1/START domain
MNRIIHQAVRLECEIRRVFEMFTVNENLEAWLTSAAEVEPVIGGKYELFWDPSDRDNNSTIGCKITAFEQDRLLSFEWKGPKHYSHFMNVADPLTHVVISFYPCEELSGQFTDVHLVHTGWGSSEDWEKARLWFDRAWKESFDRLKEQVDAKR